MITQADVRRCFGSLEDSKVAEIIELGPTLSEVELAAACLDGRTDALVKSGHHLSSTAARILEIVLFDEPVPEDSR